VRALLTAVLSGLLVSGASAVLIPYDDAKPILEANAKSISAADWPAWAAKRNAEIRARLAQGDEDSVVNLWLYGTSFTKRPRVTDREAARLGTPEAIQDLLLARLDDFVAALAKPGTNERLEFARDLVARPGIDLATAAGREKAEEYLVTVRERTIAEHQRFAREAASPSAFPTLYSDRGLSTDTRLTASFAIDKALAALAQSGWAAGGITRVGIVGPGLDFTDKAEGYDFYPPQTIQPFAVADSLARFRMASLAELAITTLDLSPRVNRHLVSARRRALLNSPYVIQLPLAKDQPSHEWHPDLVAYWQRFGSMVGKSVPAMPPPAIAGDVRVRAISIRPSIVKAMTPEDVDIIVERLALRDEDRFDLIVATNILVYYDAFEQSLALANVATMLRPGGLFLTNYAVTPLPSMEAAPGLTTSVFFDKQQNGDTIYVYRRR